MTRYPTLEFRSTGIEWQENNEAIFQWARLRNNPLNRRPSAADLPAVARSTGRFVVHGNLTIKNVTRPIDLQMEYGGARRDPYDRDDAFPRPFLPDENGAPPAAPAPAGGDAGMGSLNQADVTPGAEPTRKPEGGA